jgi:hypothetical protein
MKNAILIILVILSLVSCEEYNILFHTEEDSFESFSDSELIELAYSIEYYYPENFYHETELSGSLYYENTVSVKPIEERESIWIELSTDDQSQARQWSNLSNEYSSVNRELTEETESEKYFGFKRVNIENDQDILLSRVHKSDYFIPLYDKFTPLDTAGIYKGEIRADKVKELDEYLWDCGSLNFYEKVLSSEITDKGKVYEHRIQSLKIIHGDWGMFDIIYVFENKFTLDKTSGILTVKSELIKEIQGEYQGNPYE